MTRKQISPNKDTPIIGIAGWKKSGKTTLAVRLVEEFTNRGFSVATVKHAHHEFQIDNDETDSARHRRAGAGQVAIVSAKRSAVIAEHVDQPEPNFDEVIGWLAPADLIIVEGYKTAAIPKIEARRRKAKTTTPLADEDPLVIAVAADHEVADTSLPVFSLEDIAAIADFIDASVGPIKKRDVTPVTPGEPGIGISKRPRL